ncbi:hypothetical protein CC80DRAFT_530743 [Byssothecium circinans]|uniref:Uncharacterized protein n=1 Tax=Byssothecium circinans TaxID=147558 RepID=A0A6A5UGE9_9PLEO|nr:hypothetical protein CC80DRAFT_530743 [Byssothecium circinans]
MRSLPRAVVLGAVLFGETTAQSAVVPPTITPAPSVEEVEFLIARQDPDAISLARILLIAVPISLRQVAATNLPAVSSIIRDEFSQDKRPAWFNQLPEDIQAYLIKNFGPSTAKPTPPPGASGSGSAGGGNSMTVPGEAGAAPSGEWSWTPNPSWGETTLSSGTSTRASATSGFVTSASSSFSYPTRSLGTPSSSHTSSQSHTSKTSSTAVTPTSTSDPEAPVASTSHLTRSQKIGLGVGIPLGIFGAAAIFFACCFLLRRRRKKNANGSTPPSSPGFIPRFAFQDKSAENVEHQTPLTQHLNLSTQDLGQNGSNWEDEGIDPMETGIHNPYTMNTAYPPRTPMSNQNALNNPYTTNNTAPGAVSDSNPGVPILLKDPKPTHRTPNTATKRSRPNPTPLLKPYHTHSSNRARGMRASYTNLRSVTEVSEPDDTAESLVLGRHTTPQHNPTGGRSLLPVATSGLAAGGGNIKRKPIGTASPPASLPTSPAALTATQTLARQTMPDYTNNNSSGSGSSSSGLALTTSTGATSTSTSSSSGLSFQTQQPLHQPFPYTHQQNDPTSPVSPISPLSPHRVPSNPFTYDYDYIEDYGAEYYHSGYVDVEDGLYGNTSLSRYPVESPKSPGSRKRRGSREWPLKSVIGSVTGKGKGQRERRKSSPLWDGVVEE